MARASDTVRLLYHSRLLVVSSVGAVVLVLGLVVTRAEMMQPQLLPVAVPFVAATIALLAFTVWLGWIDYVSATTLTIDGRGVTLARRTVPWSDVRGVSRGFGSFRVRLRTDAGLVRFQLLVLPRPIVSIKELVTAATKAGAKVEPYLARLAEHVEEEDVSDVPDP